MKTAGKIFNVITIISLFIIAFWIYELDFNDLSFSNNRSSYFGIAAMLLLILSMQLNKRQINKKK
jgi:hypothetical protein